MWGLRSRGLTPRGSRDSPKSLVFFLGAVKDMTPEERGVGTKEVFRVSGFRDRGGERSWGSREIAGVARMGFGHVWLGVCSEHPCGKSQETGQL